jgi:hypothetical protein
MLDDNPERRPQAQPQSEFQLHDEKDVKPWNQVFQRGDRVRCIDADSTDLQAGKIYRVAQVSYGREGEDLCGLHLVHIYRNGHFASYLADRLRLVEKAKPTFMPEQHVRVIRGIGNCSLREGEIYRIFAVTDDGLLRLRERHLETFLPYRFVAAEPERPERKMIFKPHRGTLDEYGPPARAPAHPVYKAMQRLKLEGGTPQCVLGG